MPSVSPPPRHHALCICERCQHAGCGAFGNQPDGSPPFYVLRHRPTTANRRSASRHRSSPAPQSASHQVPHEKP